MSDRKNHFLYITIIITKLTFADQTPITAQLLAISTRPRNQAVVETSTSSSDNLLVMIMELEKERNVILSNTLFKHVITAPENSSFDIIPLINNDAFRSFLLNSVSWYIF